MQFKAETIVGIFILTGLLIFFYMTIHIGVFRLDRARYNSYTVFFNDISGLEKKSDVKIAGVTVGWVDKIELTNSGDYHAKVYLMILNRYILRSDAYAIIRQEGLIGTKYIEVIPGDPGLPSIESGGFLQEPGRAPVSMNEILQKVNQIASNVQDVTESLQTSFGGSHGKIQLQDMFYNLQQAAQRFADFSSTLDRTMSKNEDYITQMLRDFKDFAQDIKEHFPSVRESIERASNTFDRDVGTMATQLKSTSVVLEDAAAQVRDSFKNINSVATKIDEGKGLLGKIINDDDTYKDLKVTMQGVRNYMNKIDALSIVIDSHGEYMYRPAECVPFEDAKGYFNIRIHPSEDRFWLVQLVSTQKGNLYRKLIEREWFDEKCDPLLPSELIEQGVVIPQLIGSIKTTKRKLDQFKIGAQFCKIFKDVVLRFGLFENSAGMAVDFDNPFNTDKFRWITTLEAFDFRGRDRIDDKRPHLKWLNRIFFMRNLYLAFGADDFISKRNASGFFGAGVRFTDDDLKYVLSQVAFIG